MKRSFLPLLVLLPLSGLTLLLCLPPPAETHPVSAVSVLPSMTTATAGPGLWHFSGEAAGDAEGLRESLAAVSRGQGLLPAGRRHRIGSLPDLRSMKEGAHIPVSLPDGRSFDGVVNWSRRDEGYADTHQVAIGFSGDKGGLVATHGGTTDRTQGRLLVEGDKLAWTLEPDKDGALWLVEHLRADMVCELPVALAGARPSPLPGDPSVNGPGGVAPALNSRPAAAATLYMDFDGEPTQAYPDWPCSNPASPTGIPVPHSGLTADQMTLVWRRVAEDFIPFNVNVTTQRSKYNAAQAGRRMRILVAGNLPPEPPAPAPSVCVGSAGLAWIRSFQSNAITGFSFAGDIPCWLAVSAYGNPGSMTDAQLSSMASNISHELGHTLGLDHDGAAGDSDGYYDGHGTTPFDWSPIMGGPYRSGTEARSVIQWAKNDYPGANNNEDDLAMIAGPDNGFGYMQDESTGTLSASPLTNTGASQVGGTGVIANAADFDWWYFTVRFNGSTTIEVAPADTSVSVANLDCGFRVEDVLGNVVASSVAPQNNLEAKTTLNLPPGSYHVVTYGTGNLSFPDGTGYNDYGSIGRYAVTVDLPADTLDPAPVTILSPLHGAVLSNPALTFHGTALDNDRVSALSIYLRRNSDMAFWNGRYWQVGFDGAALARVFDEGTGAWVCSADLPAVGGSTPGSLNGGSYAFLVATRDPSGNTTQVESIVTVDSTGPGAVILSPVVSLGTPGYSFNGTAQDANGVQTVNCFIRRQRDGQYWNGTTWGAPPINLPTNYLASNDAAAHPWTCTTPNLPQPGAALEQGSYTFIAIAVDGLGHHAQTDSNVTIDDNAPPQVAVTGPGHNAVVHTLPAISGTATDFSGIRDSSVIFTLYHVPTAKFWGGFAWSDAQVPLSGGVTGTAWSFSLLPAGALLFPGQYLISASARDHGGTLSQAQPGVSQTSFRVDLDAPTVAILTPLHGATIAALPTISGTAGDTYGVASVRLYLLRLSDNKFWDGSSWGGGGSAILPTLVTGPSWNNITPPSLPSPGSNASVNLTNGSYDIIAIAVDTAGNEQRTDAVVTVDFHQVYTYTAGSYYDTDPDNNSPYWGNGDNWSPPGIPGADDIAEILAGGHVYLIEDVTLWGLTVSGGTINGGRPVTKTNLTVTNRFDWSGGTLGIDIHNLTIPAGCQANLTGDGLKTLAVDTFDNHGTINWLDGELNFNAVLNNTGSFIASGDANLGTRDNRAPLVFNNSGRFIKRSSTGTTSLDSNGTDFNNTGRVEVETGTLDLAGGLSSGSFTMMGNATLLINDGKPQALTTGAILNGAGICRVGGTGAVIAMSVSGNVTVDGVLELVVNAQLAGGIQNATTGALEGAGTLTGSGRMDWKAGDLLGNLSTAPGFRTAVSGTGGKQIYENFTNGGIMNWSGPEAIVGPDAVYDPDWTLTLANVFRNTGTINALAAGAFFKNYHNAVILENTGTVNTFAGGSSEIANGAVFINAGVVNIGGEGQPGQFEASRFDQTATGRLCIEIGGPLAPQFDQLHLSAEAGLGGMLHVTRINGFAPSAGDTFAAITYASYTGGFARVGGGFTVDYAAAGANLRVSSSLAFAAWATANGLTGDDALPGADPDGDGQSNFFEYVHNSNPKSASSAPDTTGTATVGGQEFLTLKYRRWADREAAGVTYTPETGTTLGNWGTAGIIEEVDPDAPVIPGSTACRCRVPVTPGQEKFLRVKAAKP